MHDLFDVGRVLNGAIQILKEVREDDAGGKAEGEAEQEVGEGLAEALGLDGGSCDEVGVDKGGARAESGVIDRDIGAQTIGRSGHDGDNTRGTRADLFDMDAVPAARLEDLQTLGDGAPIHRDAVAVPKLLANSLEVIDGASVGGQVILDNASISISRLVGVDRGVLDVIRPHLHTDHHDTAILGAKGRVGDGDQREERDKQEGVTYDIAPAHQDMPIVLQFHGFSQL